MERRSDAFSLTRLTSNSAGNSSPQQDIVEDRIITHNQSESSSSCNRSIEPDEGRTSRSQHYYEEYQSQAMPLFPTVPPVPDPNLDSIQESSSVHPNLFYELGQGESMSQPIADRTYLGGRHERQGQVLHHAYSNIDTEDPLMQGDSMLSIDQGIEPQQLDWPVQFDTPAQSHSNTPPPRSQPPFPPQQPYSTQSPMYSHTEPYGDGYYTYYPPRPLTHRHEPHSQRFSGIHRTPPPTTPQSYHTSSYMPQHHQYHPHNPHIPAPYYQFPLQNQQAYAAGAVDYDHSFGQSYGVPPFAELPQSRSSQNSPEGPNKIKQYNHNDVLCGRGGATNSHPGNKAFRKLVVDYKEKYLKAKKKEKPEVAEQVVNLVRGLKPPGRFLKKSKVSDYWVDIGDVRAKEKTSQALREGAPLIRHKKRKAHHDGDEEDEIEVVDGSFTSSEEPSPDKSIASRQKRDAASKRGCVGMKLTENEVKESKEDLDRKCSPVQQRQNKDIGEEKMRETVETSTCSLKNTEPDSLREKADSSSETEINKRSKLIHRGNDDGSDADISESGCSVYSKGISVNLGNVTTREKEKNQADVLPIKAAPTNSLSVTKRSLLKVDTTDFTQEDLSLYTVFEPPKSRLREELIRTEDRGKSSTSGKEGD